MNMKPYALRSVLSQQPQSGESPPISVADAEKAAHIRWCYQTGLEFLQYPANAAGRAGIRESAQGKGIPVAVARRYSQFASEYTEEEVEALIAACIAANFVFSFSHFRVLLGVADPSVRTELAMRDVKSLLGTVFLPEAQRTSCVGGGGHTPEPPRGWNTRSRMARLGGALALEK